MSTATVPLSVLFRCDASPSIGLGHVVRCLALADELHRNHGVSISFAMCANALATEMVERHSYPLLPAPDNAGFERFDYAHWLSDCVRQSQAQILFVDVRDNLPKAALDMTAANGVVIATLEDLSERRWAADIAFYPPVPQVRRADWSGFDGRLCVGWEWLILRSQFVGAFARHHNSRLSLLIAMGGSDPAGLTLKAVRALNRLDERWKGRLDGDFESAIIVGAGFCHRQGLHDLLRQSPRKFTVREDVSDMSAAMAQADLAICSFGMTAYELAAMGVPSVYACLTEDHRESASAMVDAGMGLSVGVDGEEMEIRLSQAVELLLVDKGLRDRMSNGARKLVDGRGAERIAELLISTAAARSGR